jgi:hypothetical protein
MTHEPDHFLDKWHQKADWLLDGALEFLAEQEESPYADGVLGDWVTQLCGFRFEERHVQRVVELVKKRDPLLAEAGIRLARGASRTIPGIADDLEVPIAEKFVKGFVDPWIVHALVDFLYEYLGPREQQLKAVYRELVSWLVSPSKPDGPRTVPMIMRNMYINPRAELIELFEQNALQTLTPSERDLIYLPALERHHQTEGWKATLVAICKKMGLDPEEHMDALRGV